MCFHQIESSEIYSNFDSRARHFALQTTNRCLLIRRTTIEWTKTEEYLRPFVYCSIYLGTSILIYIMFIKVVQNNLSEQGREQSQCFQIFPFSLQCNVTADSEPFIAKMKQFIPMK